MAVRGSARLALPVLLALLLPLAGQEKGDGEEGGAQQKPEEAPRRFLEGEERKAFLARVEKKMGEVSSFVADFTQEKSLRIFKDTVRSSGFLLFERPDRLRWEIREPFRSQLVVAGNGVAKFEYVDGKRRALKLGRAKDAILVAIERLRAWFRGEFDRKGDPFDVQVSEKPSLLIVLRPRDKALAKTLEAIELVPSADLVAMDTVTVREHGGDRTVMHFENHARDLEIPKDAFSLKEPAELDLGKLRATAGHGAK